MDSDSYSDSHSHNDSHSDSHNDSHNDNHVDSYGNPDWKENYSFTCPCSHVIKYNDNYFVPLSNKEQKITYKLFCENCGPNGCDSVHFRGMCFCGEILFLWSRISVCPKTKQIICFDCGKQKIKIARSQNSINRQRHRHENFKYLEDLDNALKEVELSGWHLFVQCVLNSYRFNFLTNRELIKKLGPEWKLLPARTREKFKRMSEQVKIKTLDRDHAIKNMCHRYNDYFKKMK